MGLILSIAFLMCSLFSYLFNGKKINGAAAFSLLWGTILLLDSMHLFGLYKSDTFTYIIIAVGVFSFVGGSLLFSNVSTAKSISETANNPSFDKWRFDFFAIVTILLLLYPAVNNIISINSGTTDFIEIRQTFSIAYKNVILKLSYNYIALPFSAACLPLCSVVVFRDIDFKCKLKAFIWTVIIIAERIFIDAGRGIMVYFLAMLIISYISDNDRKHINRKAKRIILWTALGAAVVYIALTLARGASRNSLFRQLYIYLCGCVPFLDANIREVNASGIFLYGTGGFHGIFQFVFTMLENVGICRYPQFMQLSDAMYTNTLQSRFIGSSISYNAYASAFYNVYLDCGMVSVVIEMFLYGVLSRLIYNFYRGNRKNMRNKAIYLYLMHGIIFSFIRFQFSLVSNLIAYVFIFFIMHKQKRAS